MKIGDIFYFDVVYTDNPSQTSNRSVIIIDELDNDFLLLVSTTTKGRKYPIKGYDRYKIPVPNWRKSGFHSPSWCRGKYLIKLSKSDAYTLVKKDDFIGRLHPDDFNFLIDELEKYIKAVVNTLSPLEYPQRRNNPLPPLFKASINDPLTLLKSK